MIKFFRKIRQKLIDEGNLKRYLIYAIGEILLVVIGILLAVQINEWNKERQNLNLEKQYFQRFIQDLKQDSIDLFSVTARTNINIKLCVIILDSLKVQIPAQHLNNPVYKKALRKVIIKEGRITYNDQYGGYKVVRIGQQLTALQVRRSFGITSVTIDDLTATGKMEVIRNQALRSEIQNYYSNSMANLNYENIVVQPSFSYYNDLLIDLGIPPYSSISSSEIRALAKRDKRLRTAVQHLLQANLHFAAKSDRDNQAIQKLKDEIEKEISKL